MARFFLVWAVLLLLAIAAGPLIGEQPPPWLLGLAAVCWVLAGFYAWRQRQGR